MNVFRHRIVKNPWIRPPGVYDGADRNFGSCLMARGERPPPSTREGTPAERFTRGCQEDQSKPRRTWRPRKQGTGSSGSGRSRESDPAARATDRLRDSPDRRLRGRSYTCIKHHWKRGWNHGEHGGDLMREGTTNLTKLTNRRMETGLAEPLSNDVSPQLASTRANRQFSDLCSFVAQSSPLADSTDWTREIASEFGPGCLILCGSMTLLKPSLEPRGREARRRTAGTFFLGRRRSTKIDWIRSDSTSPRADRELRVSEDRSNAPFLGKPSSAPRMSMAKPGNATRSRPRGLGRRRTGCVLRPELPDNRRVPTLRRRTEGDRQRAASTVSVLRAIPSAGYFFLRSPGFA